MIYRRAPLGTRWRNDLPSVALADAAGRAGQVWSIPRPATATFTQVSIRHIVGGP